MKKIHLLLFFLLASLLSSCFLIPDQNLGNKVLNIDGQEVPLTSKRVVYINTTALADQQNDPNAKCQATPLPANCEILAETPKVADKVVVIRIPNFKEDIPLNPNRVFVNLGVKQQLKVIVPNVVTKDSLPNTLDLRNVVIKLKFFDGEVTAEQVLTKTPDLAPVAKSDANLGLTFTLTSEACKPVTGQEGLKSCTYQTTGDGKNILRFNISDISGLLGVLGKNSKPGATITGSAALRFNNLKGGDFPVQIAGKPVTTGMVIVLSEGDTVISFR